MATNPFLDPKREIVQGKSDADILRAWQQRIEETFTRPLEDCLEEIESGAVQKALDSINADLEEVKQSVGDYLTKAQGWASKVKAGGPSMPFTQDITDMVGEFQGYLDTLSTISGQLGEREEAAASYLSGLRTDIRTAVKQMEEAEKSGDAAAVRKAQEEYLHLDSRLVAVSAYRSSLDKLKEETDALSFDITLTTNTVKPLRNFMAGGATPANVVSTSLNAYNSLRKQVKQATSGKGKNGQSSGGTP